MRVLFLSPAGQLGGAERCLLDCVAALRGASRATDIELVSLADGPLLEHARALGAHTTLIEAPAALSQLGETNLTWLSPDALLGQLSTLPEGARFLARLRGAIAGARPEVVHSNGMKAHLLAGLLVPRSAGLVVHLHDFIAIRRASSLLLPLLARARKRVLFVANSHAVARDFAGLAPRARVETIYNLVDTDYFAPGPAAPAWLAASAGLPPPPDETVSFGLVATYARWKGHGLFIEAAGRLRQLHPTRRLRFYVVGGPIYQTLGSQVAAPELLENARAAGIAADFGLSPFQEDIARVYQALNVVVHASTKPEPFGRTIVEAMACARTVLVSNAGGAAELFTDDENALGYQPNDSQALCIAMQRALEPGRRSGLEQAARRHAMAHFSRGRLAPELIRAYEKAAFDG